MKTSELAIGRAVMQILATQPNREASVKTIIAEVPKFVALTDEDREISATRPHEEKWEQRVRNLKSHSNVEGNIINDGLMSRCGRGRYRLTDAGFHAL